MSDADHNDPGMTRPDMGDTGIGGDDIGATGIFPARGPGLSPGASLPGRPHEGSPARGSGLVDPLFAWASDPGGPSDANDAREIAGHVDPSDPHPQRMGPERWVIAGGTVVALVAAFIAFTAGGTPSHAMPSPFAPQPAQSVPAQSPAAYAPAGTPTTCTPVTPAP